MSGMICSCPFIRIHAIANFLDYSATRDGLPSGLFAELATHRAVLDDCPSLSNSVVSVPPKELCSSCNCNRPISEFSFRLDNGLRKKTCYRHERKRKLALAQNFAQWSVFCDSLKLWKVQVCKWYQSELLTIRSMDDFG